MKNRNLVFREKRIQLLLHGAKVGRLNFGDGLFFLAADVRNVIADRNLLMCRAGVHVVFQNGMKRFLLLHADSFPYARTDGQNALNCFCKSFTFFCFHVRLVRSLLQKLSYLCKGFFLSLLCKKDQKTFQKIRGIRMQELSRVAPPVIGDGIRILVGGAVVGF